MFCVIALCKVKPIGQRWPILLVNIINVISFIFYNIPNNWSWGVLFTTGMKVFLLVVYNTWFNVSIFEPLFTPFNFQQKNMWSWIFDRVNVLIHIIIPRHQQNTTFYYYSWWCSRLFLGGCLLVFVWPQKSYNWYYYWVFCISALYILLLPIYVELKMFFDCLEIARSRWRNP